MSDDENVTKLDSPVASPPTWLRGPDIKISQWRTPRHPCRVTNCSPGGALVRTSATLPDMEMWPTTSSLFSSHSHIQWYFTSRCFTWLWKSWSLRKSVAAEMLQRRGVVCCGSNLSSWSNVHSQTFSTCFKSCHILCSTCQWFQICYSFLFLRWPWCHAIPLPREKQ